jgi:pimeloyl-ACP methyl ester carboxylesterase
MKQRVALSTGELTFEVAGAGRPVLFLHPAGGLAWSPVLDGLARSFTVYVPTMPGFDGTPVHEAVRSMDALATLAGEFVERVAGERCDVVGHSFGGWLAVWLAVLRPELVGHLVLEAPAGFRPKGSPPPRHEVLRHYGGGARDVDEALVARLPEIEAPALILRGTADPLIPDESVRLLRSRLRHAYLVYVWDAGHSIEADQPERMLRVVDSFLKRSDAFIVNWETVAVG